MVDVCTEYLKSRIKDAMGHDFMGDLPQVFNAMKDLKNCVDVRCGAALIRSDVLTYNGHPRRNLETQQDDLMLYDRTITFDVVIGEKKRAELDRIFTNFIISLGRGFNHEGHRISIELEDAEWVDKKDSVLNAEIAVELPVKFIGGVYKSKTYRKITEITIERTDDNGSEPMKTIEQHQGVKNTGAAVHVGAMSMAGWCAGKMVTEAEYAAAVKTFLKSGTGKG